VSQIVEVSANRKLVRRRNQQVEVKINDAWRRTVVAENMSTRTGGPSVDETRAKFEVAGKVVHVRNVDLNQKRLPPDLAKYASVSAHDRSLCFVFVLAEARWGGCWMLDGVGVRGGGVWVAGSAQGPGLPGMSLQRDGVGGRPLSP